MLAVSVQGIQEQGTGVHEYGTRPLGIWRYLAQVPD